MGIGPAYRARSGLGGHPCPDLTGGGNVIPRTVQEAEGNLIGYPLAFCPGEAQGVAVSI